MLQYLVNFLSLLYFPPPYTQIVTSSLTLTLYWCANQGDMNALNIFLTVASILKPYFEIHHRVIPFIYIIFPINSILPLGILLLTRYLFCSNYNNNLKYCKKTLQYCKHFRGLYIPGIARLFEPSISP